TQLARQRLRQRDDCALACHVGRIAREPQVRAVRAQVDDAASTVAAHARRHGLRGKEMRPQVHREQTIPFLRGELLEVMTIVAGRVVDQHRDRTESLFDALQARLQLRDVLDVACFETGRVAAVLTYGGAKSLRNPGISRYECDASALRRERMREKGAN